jgi:hypothetical protein
VLTLHIQYYLVNRKTNFIIDPEYKRFILKNGIDSTEISSSNVEQIDIYMMPSIYRGSKIQIMPFENYHYAIIYYQNGKFKITSLLSNDLYKELRIQDINLRKIKCIYPYVKRIANKA